MAQDSIATAGVVKRVWRGQARLWVAFWMFGVLGQILVWVPLAVLGFLARGGGLGEAGIFLLGMVVTLLLGFLMWIYCIVGIWRCARNADLWIWGAAARLWVIAMLLGPALLISYATYEGGRTACLEHIPNDCHGSLR